MRLCFDSFCLGPQRPLAVEKNSQSSQTTLTLATAIDNFNVTTFFNKSYFSEENSEIENCHRFSIETNSTSIKYYNNNKMISDEASNLQNNNTVNLGGDSSMMGQSMDAVNILQSVDTQNNNHISSSEMELVKNDLLNNAVDGVENIFINECLDVNMHELEAEQQLTSKEKDLIKVIQIKDVKIKELEALLYQKNEEIANLKSHLDKFQSVFQSPFSRATGAIGRKMGRSIQRQRAQGISAEPQSQSALHELLNVSFPKYEKEER